jgi:GTPase
MFIDRVRLVVKGGDGGRGVISFRREAHVPRGGPDGGDGGKGGDVVLRVDPQLGTLADFRFSSEVAAEPGGSGAGQNRTGRSGGDRVQRVPPGTLVVDRATGERVADLVAGGEEIVVARGGRGGKGNARFATSTRRAPRIAEDGGAGERRDIELELKLLADVGLAGMPNAGKSTLLAALTSARPKIADYPFTTLVPNLGVVTAGSLTFTVADVPGLIEGASEGRGLGHDFLRHVERCAALVHVIDCATAEPGRDPVTDLDTIEAELAAYGGLDDRPRLVALNKVDVPDAKHIAEFVTADLEDRGFDVFAVSAASHEGLRELSFAMAEIVARRRAAEAAPEPTRIVLRPQAPVGVGEEFTITVEDHQYRVRGEKPTRWVRQTDFANDEAVGYLADRLNRLGVEERLLAMGAERGDDIVIGDAADAVIFDFDPQIDAGAENLGRRGEDHRFYDRSRRTNVGRREELAAKRAHEAEMRALRQAHEPHGEHDETEDES